jgi:hypothetical protein
MREFAKDSKVEVDWVRVSWIAGVNCAYPFLLSVVVSHVWNCFIFSSLFQSVEYDWNRLPSAVLGFPYIIFHYVVYFFDPCIASNSAG